MVLARRAKQDPPIGQPVAGRRDHAAAGRGPRSEREQRGGPALSSAVDDTAFHAVPRPRTPTQIVFRDSSAFSIVNFTSGMARCRPVMDI